jgi:hypothetical protein
MRTGGSIETSARAEVLSVTAVLHLEEGWSEGLLNAEDIIASRD